ncbi:MbcA/ParS/Xre antitoxin family protein [Aromatoleum toluolicum]|uniref:DUF2384 domain-containing protein n=1 Tax=Aromatoleum toluolicum TaxID=90060 RepID=A0ABX1NB32_9RHOO|nr:MbcA/ParS/Xre antitoxin family protein [Aromatoleum toluolicum]NMF96464.1 MbcA/ParS/Xre antitoxin family protein [Aromatoleum toluolicum]
MKRLVVGLRTDEPDPDPREEHAEDVARLVAVATSGGYHVSPQSAAALWRRYGEALCPDWVPVAGLSDAALMQTMLRYATVEDVPDGRTDLTPCQDASCSVAVSRREEVEALARFVWNDGALAENFLTMPHPLLGGRTPRSMLESEDGLCRVETILKQLFYGLPV